VSVCSLLLPSPWSAAPPSVVFCRPFFGRPPRRPRPPPRSAPKTLAAMTTSSGATVAPPLRFMRRRRCGRCAKVPFSKSDSGGPRGARGDDASGDRCERSGRALQKARWTSRQLHDVCGGEMTDRQAVLVGLTNRRLAVADDCGAQSGDYSQHTGDGSPSAQKGAQGGNTNCSQNSSCG